MCKYKKKWKRKYCPDLCPLIWPRNSEELHKLSNSVTPKHIYSFISQRVAYM